MYWNQLYLASDHSSYVPAGLSWALSSGGMQLFTFQSKQKASQSIGQKFREKQKLTDRARPPPLTHTNSQTCTQAHKHPHLVDRERMGDSDLLIYESFHSVKPRNDVSTDGWGTRPGQSGGTDWQSAGVEERDKERRERKSFHQVHVEPQLLARWWVSQNSELLSWEKPATLLGPDS